MKLLAKIFDLLILGVIFIVFLFYVISDSINFFFNGNFFEGFMVVGMTFIFTLINLPILIIIGYRKDYQTLKLIGTLVASIFVLGFFGFRIPLIILPIIISYGIFYIASELRIRIINYKTKSI